MAKRSAWPRNPARRLVKIVDLVQTFGTFAVSVAVVFPTVYRLVSGQVARQMEDQARDKTYKGHWVPGSGLTEIVLDPITREETSRESLTWQQVLER